jgi:hypothetical protein
MMSAGTFFTRIYAQSPDVRIFPATIFTKIFLLFTAFIYGMFTPFRILPARIDRQSPGSRIFLPAPFTVTISHINLLYIF